jgi:hypothetical protein
VNVLAALAMAVLSVPPSSEPTPIPEGYTVLVDDTGLIAVAVPETWTEVDTAPAANDDGTPRPSIAASPNIQSFLTTFDTPGVWYAAFPFAPDPLVLIDSNGLNRGCETIEVKEYSDPVFVGVVQVGTNCGPQAMTWNMVVASPPNDAFTAVVQVQTTSAEELETVRLTFNVTPDGTMPGSSVPGSTSVPTSTSVADSTTVPSSTTVPG